MTKEWNSKKTKHVIQNLEKNLTSDILKTNDVRVVPPIFFVCKQKKQKVKKYKFEKFTFICFASKGK